LKAQETPTDKAYTNPATGATSQGSLSIIDITNGQLINGIAFGIASERYYQQPA
jgi:hypothetical protein